MICIFNSQVRFFSHVTSLIFAVRNGAKFNPGGRQHIGPGKQRKQNVWSSKARDSSVMQQDADTLEDNPLSSSLHTQSAKPFELKKIEGQFRMESQRFVATLHRAGAREGEKYEP